MHANNVVSVILGLSLQQDCKITTNNNDDQTSSFSIGVERNNRYEVMVKGVRLIEKIMTDKFKAKQMGITAKWKFLNEK